MALDAAKDTLSVGVIAGLNIAKDAATVFPPLQSEPLCATLNNPAFGDEGACLEDLRRRISALET